MPERVLRNGSYQAGIYPPCTLEHPLSVICKMTFVKFGMPQLIAAPTFHTTGIQKLFHAFLWLKIVGEGGRFHDSATDNY